VDSRDERKKIDANLLIVVKALSQKKE